MPAASFLQTSFLGGVWSPTYQGNATDEDYRKALNVCFNAYPMEQGTWNRRAGTRLVSSTRNGQPGRLLSFNFSNGQPYMMEFTDGYLRFNNGQSLLLDTSPPVISAISTADPAVITTAAAHGWSTNDHVVFLPNGSPKKLALALCNTEWRIVVLSSTTFSIFNALTNQPFDGSTITWVDNPAQVARVTTISTPYTAAAWKSVRKAQNQNLVLLLHGAITPYCVQATPPSGVAGPTFSLAQVNFEDGPYMDPVPNGTILTQTSSSPLEYTVSYQVYSSTQTYNLGDVAQSSGGTVYQSLVDNNLGNSQSNASYWVAVSGWPGVNGGQGFVSTDVGRMLRIFMQPAAWASGTSYSAGQSVTYNDAFYTSLVSSNVGNEPDTSPTDWQAVVNTAVAGWAWLTISAVVSTSVIEAQLQGSGSGLINTTVPIATWQLGLYSNTTGFPTSGTYAQGRFWLAGAQANRIDATVTNALPTSGWVTTFNMAPTGFDGTVSDNNGLSLVFESDEADAIVWAIPDHQGIVCGSSGGEWAITSSNLSDPITPTSVQAHKVTKYKAASVEAIRTGIAINFVQLHQQKLMEYVCDVYSGKYSAFNLSKKANNLPVAGIAEICYVQEPVPVIWYRDNSGNLFGCTYKRESPFSTQPASFFGHHAHALGTGRSVISVQAGPSPNGGLTDSLTMVTQDSSGYCWIETMQQPFDENVQQADAWQVDGAVIPQLADYVTGSPNVVRLYGLSNYIGGQVDIWAGGIDVGTFTVSSTGTVDIPVDNGGLLTSAFMASVLGGANGSTRVDWGAGPPAVNMSATILHYTPTDGISGNDYQGYVCADWDLGYVYSASSQYQLRQYNINTQVETNYIHNTSMGGFSSQSGIRVGRDGYVYAYGGSWFNDGKNMTYKIRQSDLKVMGGFHWGSPDGPIAPGQSYYTPGRLPASCLIDQHFLIYSGLESLTTSCCFNIIATQGMQTVGSVFQITEKQGCAVDGIVQKSGSYQLGTTWIVGNAKTGSSAVSLYALTIDNSPLRNIAMTQIGSKIAVASLYTGWLNTDSVNMDDCYPDQTDGNVIVEFNNTTQSQVAMVKLNTTNGTVMWSYLCTGTTGTVFPGDSWAGSIGNNYRIRNGQMMRVDGNGNAWTLNTFTGVATKTAAAGGLTMDGGTSYISNDDTGMVIWRGSSTYDTFGPNTASQNFGNGLPPYTIPFCVGTSFTSQGQLLRAIMPQEAGAANGPALGKVRRSQMTGFLLRRTGGISQGVDGFTKTIPMRFTSPGGNVYAANALFSGVWWDTVNDKYSFDSMVCWQVTRPYPATVCAVEVFLETQDRG